MRVCEMEVYEIQRTDGPCTRLIQNSTLPRKGNSTLQQQRPEILWNKTSTTCDYQYVDTCG